MRFLATIALAGLLVAPPPAFAGLAGQVKVTSVTKQPNRARAAGFVRRSPAVQFQHLVSFPSYYSGNNITVRGRPGTHYTLNVRFKAGSALSDFRVAHGTLGSSGYTNYAMWAPHNHAAHANQLTYEVAEIWSTSTKPVVASVLIYD